MKSRVVCIKNSAGIHCRPSSVILSTIKKEFPHHSFMLAASGSHIGLDSILSLISLGLAAGATAELSVEGPEEELAIQRVGDLFEFEFDFPQE